MVSWFQSTRDQLRRQHGRIIPSLAFVHIPVQATAVFQQSGKRTEATEPGLNYDYIGHQGECPDSPTCWNGGDKSFMRALVETEGLLAVFSGHDHGIEYVLCYLISMSGHCS